MKKDQFFKTKKEIEEWLNKYEIENFVINEDLTVDVNGNVELENNEIEEFPFQFGIIEGDFDCSYNCLISLKNSPKEVNGSFYCSCNKLENLEYCPKKINGNFNCGHNNLTSLEYCPEKVYGNFYCAGNNLTSLEYCPEKVYGDFNCSHNKLTILEYYPKQIGGYFNCISNNLKKELLFLFDSKIKGDIKSDFGDKQNFLNEVIKQKLLKEKEELNKIITPEINSSVIKKRL